MKKHFIFACMACALMASMAHAQQSWTADNGNGTFTNPLFYDEFSDPDIIRVGEDYYLAGTTMHATPGLVILHSKDLVNWEFSSYCFDKFNLGEAFKLEGGKTIYGQGIWAPCIRYHEGKFYVFSNINGVGLQVFISDSAKGPWKHINMGGNIYDLSVLFEDDGTVWAIHKYGAVRATQIKPDFSGYVEGSEREIIPAGSAMGEGHHVYKIDGKYYIISADYSPMGRMQCAKADNLFGPYETVTISMTETLGTKAARTVDNVSLGSPIPGDNFKFNISNPSDNTMSCATLHQGGIVDTPDGEWWGVSMLDFNAVGRTTCLSPVTWKGGYPYFGIEGNLGRTPRTWTKPKVKASVKPHAPYVRNDEFESKSLQPVWQWNHEPQDGEWSLKKGVLSINALPAKDFLWAKNTLTQRAIGPVSTTTVWLYFSKLKNKDEAGLGILNMPYATLGVKCINKQFCLAWAKQEGDKKENVDLGKAKGVWLRITGDYDAQTAQFSYSIDNKEYKQIGEEVLMPYQLRTFQGARVALYAFNHGDKVGGKAQFDHFTVDEPMADRSQNLPLGKVITLTNLGNGNQALAHGQGILHQAWKGSRDYNGKACQFRVHDRGNGLVALEAMNGKGFVTVVGEGLSADVRLLKKESQASLFMWQDMLRGECMLLSMKTHRFVGLNPTTGEPYSALFDGTTPNRKNGAVFAWKVVE